MALVIGIGRRRSRSMAIRSGPHNLSPTLRNTFPTTSDGICIELRISHQTPNRGDPRLARVREQIYKFLVQLPASESIALYVRKGDGFRVLTEGTAISILFSTRVDVLLRLLLQSTLNKPLIALT
jgi:hypothetical protein